MFKSSGGNQTISRIQRRSPQLTIAFQNSPAFSHSLVHGQDSIRKPITHISFEPFFQLCPPVCVTQERKPLVARFLLSGQRFANPFIRSPPFLELYPFARPGLVPGRIYFPLLFCRSYGLVACFMRYPGDATHRLNGTTNGSLLNQAAYSVVCTILERCFNHSFDVPRHVWVDVRNRKSLDPQWQSEY